MTAHQSRIEQTTAMPSDSGIQVRGLTRRYGEFIALNSVDLEVSRGEIVALLGQNGAGKSTLIRVLATSLMPHEGSVAIDGHDVVAQPQEARRAIGLVLAEERSFYWRLTGRQNLEFFAALRGIKRREAKQRTINALQAVALLDVADRRTDRYSTGMRIRLALARALLDDPVVLLLDEPTRSLDAVAVNSVRELVLELARQRNAAVLFATHNLHEASAVASRTVVIHNGSIVTTVAGGTDAAGLERTLLALVQ